METENVDSVEDIRHELIRESMTLVDDPRPFEMTTIGDIPSRGAGLGSSSSLVVGILKLFYPNIGPLELAQKAIEVEVVNLGKGVGWQDHLAAVYGGCRQYAIQPSRYAGTRNFMIDATMLEAAGCHVGHKLVACLLAFRLPNDRSHDSRVVGIHSNLTEMREQMEKRVPYLRETVDLVDDMAYSLQHWGIKAIVTVGEIMRKAWELKKASHAYVDKNIERWYSIGIENGALAGKVSGSMSKGAGHLFFLAYPDDHDRIRAALGEELAEMKVEYYPHGSKVWEI
jgi:D-glycero-alpha-D-manno-heptose-7-phosphate kinase